MSDEGDQAPGAAAPEASVGLFRVTNVSTTTIYGTVEHRNDAVVDFSGGLPQGQSTAYVKFSPSTFTDTWAYRFKSGLGTFQGTKNCSFSSSSDTTIDIVLSGAYLAIVPSITSPCTGSLDKSLQEGEAAEAKQEPEAAPA